MVRYLYAALAIFAINSPISVGAHISEEKAPLRVAIVTDDCEVSSCILRENLISEVNDLFADEVEVVFSPKEAFVGGLKVKEAVLQALRDPNYDMVVTLGPISSAKALALGPFEKPLFAPFIINQKLQNAPLDGEYSGVKNLNYTTLEVDLRAHLALFKKLAPVKHLGFVVNERLLKAVPALARELNIIAQKEHIRLTLIPLKEGRALEMQVLPKEVDALYVALLPFAFKRSLRPFSEQLINRKIASYSFSADPFIKEGLLMSQSPGDAMERVLRRVAISMQRAYLGQKPEEFNVYLIPAEKLFINASTASALGIAIPFEVMLEAELVDECEQEQQEKLSFLGAICEGVTQNAYLGAKWHELLAACQVPKLSRAALLPQVELGSEARKIDKNTALLANGLAPERLLNGFLGLRQMIYSNERIGQYLIDKEIRNSLVQDYNDTTLETILQIASAYLGLLRARNITLIQKNNLKLTQENLLLAEQRVAVGVARMSEVYRWESQLSNNKANLVIASFRAKNAETELLRLLNRRQDEGVQVEGVSLEESFWLIKPKWFASRYASKCQMEKLAHLAVCEGFRFSPKITSYLYQIAAKTQGVGVAKRAFWTPDLFFKTAIDQRLITGGAATAPLLNVDTQWIFGVELHFPLYVGGAKRARLNLAKQELKGTKLALDATTELVEQNIRVSLYDAAASYTSIGLTKDALKTAKKNLDLVLNNYSKGQAPILDLLDAQAQVLIAELEHTDALYGFLVDFVRLQRSIGRFDFLLSPEEKNCFKEKLDAYVGELP